MTRTYAADTEVPINRSRSEIDKLLSQWGCDRIQWTDDFAMGCTTLRFQAVFDDVHCTARLELHLPPDDVVGQRFARTPTQAQLAGAREQHWRALHRVLLLTIKAQLNAVEAGLLTAVEAFLPHLEDSQGRTVAQLAVPHLRRLQDGKTPLLEA